MAILLPNYLQTGSYSAKKDRRVNSAMVLQEGIVRKGHFALAQRGAGANMSVDVATGEAWVKGDSAVDQGYYHVVNDATINVPLTAANATLPRIDAIVLAVNDSTEVGGSDSYLLEAIAGAATTGATLANLKGAATPGATKLLLGYVLVAAAATKVETAAMGGLRDPRAYREEFGAGAKAEPYAVAGAPPQYAHGRPLDYVPSARALATAGEAVAGAQELLYPAESFDNDEIHSTTSLTGRLVAKTPGLYLANCISNPAAGNVHTFIGLNGLGGAETIGMQNNGAAAGVSNTVALVRMGYGDFILSFYGTATTSSHPYAQVPSFSMIWQGP